MARFADDTIRHPPNPTVGTGMLPSIPAPPPARLIPSGGDVGSEYGANMTLSALMARQKELADQQANVTQMPAGNIYGGLAMLANTLVNALAQRRARKAEEAGQAEVAQAFHGGFNDEGMLPPEAMDTLMRREPELGIKLYEQAMALKAQKAKQDVYGPVLTGEAASALGLDPAKQYQLNKTTGQYDPIGGAGTSINVGTGEKLTESLVKDTTYYPGALNANLELDDLDQVLTSAPDVLKEFVPGGNFLTSPEYQRAKVAGDAWIMNILRRESGATISESEWASNRATYLPQPGDDAETIAYKRRLREERTATLRYGLEAAAPTTLEKIDKAYATQKQLREERRRKKSGVTTPPSAVAPAATTPDQPAATIAAPPDSFLSKRPANITPENWIKAWGSLTPEQRGRFK